MSFKKVEWYFTIISLLLVFRAPESYSRNVPENGENGIKIHSAVLEISLNIQTLTENFTLYYVQI